MSESYITCKSFEDFLEKKDRHLYNILKFVMNSDKTTISYEELFKVTNVSVLTLYDLIKELKELTKSLGTVPALKIEIESSTCYHFYKERTLTLDYYFAFFLQRSQYFLILIDLLYGRKRTIEKFADRLFISESSVIRKIKKLKEILYKFQLGIGKRNKKYILIGEEEKIRYFYYLLFKVSDYSLSEHQKCKEDESLACVIKELYPNITQNTLDNFMYFFYISFVRAKQGLYIKNEFDYFKIKNRLFSFEDFENKLHRYISLTDCKKEVYKRELACLYFFISTDDLLTLKTILSVSAYLSPSMLKNQFFILGNTIVYYVSKYFNVKFNPEEYFFLGANFYIIMKKIRIFYYYCNGLDYSSITLEKYNKDIFSMFSDYFKKETGDELPLPLNYLEQILFEILPRKGSKITVMVYSASGDRQKEIIEQRLKNIISIPISYVNRLEQQPNVILSDSYLNVDKKTLIYYIKNGASNQEISLVSKYIEELYFNLKRSELDESKHRNYQ